MSGSRWARHLLDALVIGAIVAVAVISCLGCGGDCGPSMMAPGCGGAWLEMGVSVDGVEDAGEECDVDLVGPARCDVDVTAVDGAPGE